MQRQTKKTKVMKNSAVIYARVSSVTDRQNTRRQVIDLEQYAAAVGLEVVKVFEEKITGAAKNTARPVLKNCLDFCDKERPAVLLVSELSRLGRNTWEILEAVKYCLDHGQNVYFAKEQFSLFTATGAPSPFAPVVISCLGMSAQLERENIAYRLNSGRAQYVAAGGRLGRPVGSTKNVDKLLASHPAVVAQLRKTSPKPIRDIAAICGVSPTTVQKVKKAMSAL